MWFVCKIHLPLELWRFKKKRFEEPKKMDAPDIVTCAYFLLKACSVKVFPIINHDRLIILFAT